MLIYAGTKSDFMIDTENDRLETKLYENIKLKMNRTTGLSELNAWRNSLKEMSSFMPSGSSHMTTLIILLISVQKTVNCHGTDRRTQPYSLHF